MKARKVWRRFVLLLHCHGFAMMVLAAPQPANHLVTLAWTPDTQPADVTIEGWNVYRSTVSSGPYTMLASVPVATLTYTDTSVAAGDMYFYVVTSVDTAGVESMYSASATATIPLGVLLSVATTMLPPTVVGAPYSVMLSAVGGNPPYTWVGSGVPGWTVSSAGLLSGTPTQSGVFVLSLTVADSTGATATASIPVVVAQLTPNPVPNGKLVQYVDCGSSNGLINSINNALASLDPSEDNTVYVLGACKENVTISGFDRLQLIAQNGASISDASGDTAPAISIDYSTRVSVQGFIINGNGPNAQTEVIDCTFSYCAFSGNTVQGGADGVDIASGARASFKGDVLQNNASGAGIFVGQNAFVQAIGVTTQSNGQGASVGGGFLQINSSTVQNNVGDGIVVSLGGTANLSTSTVTGNRGNGISVVGHSTLQLGFAGNGNGGPGSSVTNNSGAGILVKDLSFANFPGGVTNVVSGNVGGKDVICSPQFSATRGALTNIGGGTTNCNEP